MNKDRLIELGLLVALLATIRYWRKREASLRASLTVSREWTAPAAAERPTDDGASAEAARLLDTRPEDLPERVAALTGKVDELTNDLERARANWAARWWTARQGSLDEPFVAVVDLSDGELADAKALTKAAPEGVAGVAIVVAGDGTLAVAVTGGLDHAASDVAKEVAQAAGGNAGGTGQMATGGGDAARLPDAAETVAARLRDELDARGTASADSAGDGAGGDGEADADGGVDEAADGDGASEADEGDDADA